MNFQDARESAVAGIEAAQCFVVASFVDGKPIFSAWMPTVIDRLAMIAYLDVVKDQLSEELQNYDHDEET